jgi:hypothetical protein
MDKVIVCDFIQYDSKTDQEVDVSQIDENGFLNIF